MKPLLLLASLFLALPAFTAEKVEQWIHLMPKDTIGVMAFKNMPELLSDWDKSAFGRFMQDEEVKRWLEPMKDQGEMPWDKYFREIYGTGLHDTLKHETGPAVAFFVPGNLAEMEKTKSLPFVGLSDASQNQATQEEQKRKHREHLKKGEHPQLKESTLDIAGASVSIATDSDEAGAAWVDAFCFVEGVMIETTDRRLMEYMIGAVKSGSGEAGDEVRGHFERLMQLREGVADVTVYLNNTRLLDLAKQVLAEAEKNKGPNNAAPNPMGDVKPEQIIEAIGLQEVKGLALSLDFADDCSHAEMFVFHSEKPSGFLSWLSSNEKEVELPAFIAEDVAGASVSTVEWLKVYDGLMGTLSKISPQMGMMATMYLAGFEQQNGFKIRDDFFGSLRGAIQASDIDGKTQSDVMGFKIQNADKLGTALKGLQNALGGMGFAAFEESDYLGYTLHTLKAGGGGSGASATPEIAYVNTGKYLLIGSGKLDALRKVLARMKDPSGSSIWETPRAQSQLALLPKGFNALSVTDSSKMTSLFFNTLEMVSKQASTQQKAAKKKKGPGKGPAKGGDGSAKPAADPGNELAKFVDSKNRPSDATFQKYFGTMMSANYAHPDAMHIHMLATPVEAK